MPTAAPAVCPLQPALTFSLLLGVKRVCLFSRCVPVQEPMCCCVLSFHPPLSLDNVTHETSTRSGVKPQRQVCVGYRERRRKVAEETILSLSSLPARLRPVGRSEKPNWRLRCGRQRSPQTGAVHRPKTRHIIILTIFPLPLRRSCCK